MNSSGVPDWLYQFTHPAALVEFWFLHMRINTWDCLSKKLPGMALQTCWSGHLFGKKRQEELKLKVTLDYIGNWRIYETLSQENRQKLKPAEDGWWYLSFDLPGDWWRWRGCPTCADSLEDCTSLFPVLCGVLSTLGLCWSSLNIPATDFQPCL